MDDFIKSSSKKSEYIHEEHPNFIVVRHFNIEKSSFIKTLIHYKELAQTSKKSSQCNLYIRFHLCKLIKISYDFMVLFLLSNTLIAIQ